MPNLSTTSWRAIPVQYLESAPAISRFSYLLRRVEELVQTNGPYTTYAGTTVFTRAPLARSSTKVISTSDLAVSLAAAQDSVGTAQIDRSTQEDSTAFKILWDTAIVVLEDIIQSGDLDHESFGWGILGLCAGYMPGHWSEDSLFLAHKMRLHDALKQLPSMDSPGFKRDVVTANVGEKIWMLAKANREVHICANLLLQQFRREEWKRIRWYHAIAVAQRWMGRLNLEPSQTGDSDGT